MKTYKGTILAGIAFFAVVSTLSFSTQAQAGPEGLSRGQLVYVPAYSHIYMGNNEKPFLLTVTLSIRNINPAHAIRITAVDYHETQGTLAKAMLTGVTTLKPLESLRYVIPEKDRSGGSGANFMVTWESDTLVNPPIIESIMIGAQNQQGISFTSRGKTLIPNP